VKPQGRKGRKGKKIFVLILAPLAPLRLISRIFNLIGALVPPGRGSAGDPRGEFHREAGRRGGRDTERILRNFGSSSKSGLNDLGSLD